MGRKRHFRQNRGGKKRPKRTMRSLLAQKKKGKFQNSEQQHEKEAKSAENVENPQVSEESESEEEAATSSYQQLLSSLGKSAHNCRYSDEENESEEEAEEEELSEEEFANQPKRGDSNSKDESGENVEEEEDGSDVGRHVRSLAEESEEEVVDSKDENKSDKDFGKDESGKDNIDEEEDDIDEEDDGTDEDDEVGTDEEDGGNQEEDNNDEGNNKGNLQDIFFRRMDHDIGETMAAKLAEAKVCYRAETKWPRLGRLVLTSLTDQPTDIKIEKGKSLQELHVRKRIADQWRKGNSDFLQDDSQVFSPLQEELFTIMNSYQDLLYTERSHMNAEELRHTYCLHILNHILKTRDTVRKHNSALSADSSLDSETMRDQGLIRPRALIVVPFRSAALRIVNIFIKLMESDQGNEQQVSHRKRFQEEYSELDPYQSKGTKPEDYEAIFSGNTDDHFRIGLAVSRKHLRLYTKFYLSDIIIASPLGLRTVIGSKGEKHQDYDFLSSIEVLLMDQTDVFLMQNWEHIMHLMEYMHLQPKESHDVDFSRVRNWALNEWSKFYRQTLIFSSGIIPEISALYNRHCYNFAGQVLVQNPPINGSICQVAIQLPQVFHKVECGSFTDAPQKRFDFFVTKILPQFSESIMTGTMIFVPSYFDFVRLRNYFRKQEIKFAQICEYTSQSNISRARQYMLHKERHFLLYTERFHYYRRLQVRAIRHIIFYQLPAYPHFYSELCNLLDSGQGTVTDHNCTVLYSRYDAHRMAAVVGTQRCAHMLSTEKNVHMLVSGEDR